MKALIIACFSLLMFLPLRAFSESRTWNGEVDSSWSNADNWSPAGIPQQGDDVIIPKSMKVIISEETPNLNSLSLTGTLMTSNWLTAVRADIITIKKNGELTCGHPFESTEPSNRVWIVCRDLTVESGGKINVNDKGYKYLNGPGKGAEECGASYGGHGGGGWISARTPLPKIYGDAKNPLEPGSGGSYTGGDLSSSCRGGGAVLIEASGTVTVNGAITACSTTEGFGSNDGMGSGGSVLIRTKRFKGSGGSILANGANGRTNWNTSEASGDQSMAGGGGRISIQYNPAEQEEGDIANMQISAAGGKLYLRNKTDTGIPSYYRSFVAADKYWFNADIGTLWFSDNRIVTESEGMTIIGQLVYTNRFDFSSLNVTKGHFRFAAEETVVNVTGDMNIHGINTRVEFGGSEAATNRLTTTDIRVYRPWVLNVGGNLTISDGARMDVRSAETNGTDVAGCYVNVAGDMKILGRASGEFLKIDQTYKTENTSVYCYSDRINGGSPLFKVRSLTVEENAIFTASKRGFASGAGETMHSSYGIGLYGVWMPNGLGPGGGVGNSSGSVYGAGGYGGRGSNFSAKSGLTYGDPLWPMLAGSGGSARYAAHGRTFGGGVVHVKADTYIIVDGTVSADGESRTGSWMAGGSGGSILLQCRRFSGGETGLLSACGGNGTSASNKSIGGGGGGRIAVWTGKPWQQNSKIKNCTIREEPFLAQNANEKFLGTVKVDGGVDTTNPENDALKGEPGTIRFVDYTGIPGLMIYLR